MDRLASLLEFHAEDPDDAFVRFALASEYRKRGETDTARSYFEGLVAHEPDYVGTYYHLGKLYEDLGEPARASETYRTGISVAGRVRDQHAKAELQSALMELEIGDD